MFQEVVIKRGVMRLVMVVLQQVVQTLQMDLEEVVADIMEE